MDPTRVGVSVNSRAEMIIRRGSPIWRLRGPPMQHTLNTDYRNPLVVRPRTIKLSRLTELRDIITDSVTQVVGSRADPESRRVNMITSVGNETVVGGSTHDGKKKHANVEEFWIYAYDPETKQQSTVWVFQDEPNPTKVIRVENTLKQMVALFFGINGHVVAVPLENRKMVNSEWYTTICLPEVFEETRKNNRQRNHSSS
ncbi:hypothetical protein EVAR_59408_1 [Eumeta japonica]|uniref:Uncharacterized protein n=1 Tax=Eumeta variegata TaxID=151549 RepID=A0A4C1YYK5_EUMVA|nr:hypothetical protein EVAR_59408_1 [Eumeta japonica]